MNKHQRHYAEALAAHLEQPREDRLAAAYDLGREYAAKGLAVPDVTAMHFAVLRDKPAFLAAKHLDASHTFLAEVARAMNDSGSPQDTTGLLTALYNNNVRQIEELRKIRNRPHHPIPTLEKKINEKRLALRAAEERFEILVQTIPDIIYKIDRQGKFIYLNNAIKELGYKPDDLIGKHFRTIILPAELEQISSLAVLPKYAGQKTGAAKAPKLFDERRSRDRKTTGLTVRLLLKAESFDRGVTEPPAEHLIIVEINSSGIHEINPSTRKKEFVGTVGVIRDITIREKAEAKLRRYRSQLEELVAERTAELSETNKTLQQEIREREKSENFAKEILDSMGEGLVVLDPDYHIITANKSYARQAQKPLTQIIGRTCYKISHNRDKHCREWDERCPVQEALVNGVPSTAIHQHTDRDGNLYFVEINSYPMKNAAGQIISAIEIIRDISKQKKLEDQLRHAQKMEAIATLAGGVAHDFNNILTGIIGYTELALLRTEKDSQIRRDLQEVQKAGRRATDLVKQILAVSRRKDPQECGPIPIGPIVKEALKLLRASLPSTIEIRQHIAISPDNGVVEANPSHIHQVLMNLCTNAALAMQDKGGILEIRLANAETPATTAGLPFSEPCLKLSVRDTGHGIPPEIMDRIYDPYFTTREKGKGTGLGLAMVRSIVTGCGGRIIAASDVEKGSTFDVFFPTVRKARKQEAAVADTAGPPPRGHEQILYIDDEPAVVAVEKRLLEGLGYKVITCTNPLDALHIFKKDPGRFDLVITDFTMPLMRGDQLTKEILAIRPDLPIILCTGFNEQISEDRAKILGVKTFAMKPFTSPQMAKAIRDALENR